MGCALLIGKPALGLFGGEIEVDCIRNACCGRPRFLRGGLIVIVFVSGADVVGIHQNV